MSLVTTISGINVFQFDIDVLANLSTTQLRERLVQIEKLGKETAASACGEIVTTAVRRGCFVPVDRREYALNGQRRAWAATKAALNLRQQKEDAARDRFFAEVGA